MRLVMGVLCAVVMLTAAGCSKHIGYNTPESKFIYYDGPDVTRIEIHKSTRRMYLFHHDEVLKAYGVELGFAPVGDKQRGVQNTSAITPPSQSSSTMTAPMSPASRFTKAPAGCICSTTTRC